MKLIALLGAGALAAGTLGAAPAEAQYRGQYEYHHGHRYYGGYHNHRGGYGYGYRGGYRSYGGGFYRHGFHGRPRVICRVHRGYYGPVRRCFRAY